MDAPQTPAPADAPERAAPAKAGRRSLARWQDRLLPVMVGVLVALAAFFFIATVVQLATLQRSISDVPKVVLPAPAASDASRQEPGAYPGLSAHQLDILATMEAYVVEQRYHQASVLLMAGLWTRYLGFVTGMVLALVGASFILGKLEAPPTELEGKGAGVEGSLKTASPGIVLVVLGAVLMLATIVNRDTYQTHDAAVYLPTLGEAGISQGATATAVGTAAPPTGMPLGTAGAPTRSP
jgi:hypothetical protein